MEPSTSSSSAVFQFDARVRYSEVDHRGLLTLPKLIDYFQDCSTFQSEALGVGMLWLKEHRRAWVLTHWQIVVERYPRLAEPITVGYVRELLQGPHGDALLLPQGRDGRDSREGELELGAPRP